MQIRSLGLEETIAEVLVEFLGRGSEPPPHH